MSPAGEHARAPGHQRARHLHGAIALELHPRHRAQERGVGVLAERQDHRVRRERLEAPGRLREPRIVELHHLDLQLLALKRLDRPQPVDPHALPLGVLRLLLVRGHLLAGAAVDDQRLLARPGGAPSAPRPSPCSRRRRPRRDARSPGRSPTPPRAGTTRHPRSARRPPAGISTRFDRCAPTATNTASKPPSRRSASRSVTRWLPVNLDAQRPDPLDLPAEHVAGHPVGRDPVAHHARPARRRRRGSRPRDQPRQVVGGRQPARARRRSPAPACRCGPAAGRTPIRAPAPDRPRNRSTA